MTTLPDRFPAYLATKTTGADGKPAVARELGELAAADLPSGDLTLRVLYSSVNYKDSLATLADGGVARISPLVPGIDAVGEIVETHGPTELAIGEKVIVHGYTFGTAQHGGYAHYARIPEAWAVPLPAGLSPREAMAIGTAGFTAAQSVHALEQFGLNPSRGPVLVTGATGGVGSCALTILARKGWEVWASTGKESEHAALLAAGATGVLTRDELATDDGRPIGKERWAAVVDCVGGTTLATALKTTKAFGAIAASGNTGGIGLATTVFPFILRGVALLGIDSVGLDMAARRTVWGRCATDLRPAGIDDSEPSLVHEIGLDGLEAALTSIRAGLAKGRTVVRVTS